MRNSTRMKSDRLWDSRELSLWHRWRKETTFTERRQRDEGTAREAEREWKAIGQGECWSVSRYVVHWCALISQSIEIRELFYFVIIRLGARHRLNNCTFVLTLNAPTDNKYGDASLARLYSTACNVSHHAVQTLLALSCELLHHLQNLFDSTPKALESACGRLGMRGNRKERKNAERNQNGATASRN
ncbi:hypothetical protein TRVL_05143 [Trypanosoma vivax]|nr:hypothetical protein TRVL_05143 [Trypanosoma vivax]